MLMLAIDPEQLEAHDVGSVRVRDRTRYIYMLSRSRTTCTESQIVQTGYIDESAMIRTGLLLVFVPSMGKPLGSTR